MIGATIALISKSEVRYVGTLEKIDKDTATVSLAHGKPVVFHEQAVK